MSRHRNYCFTYNNYPDTSLVDAINCKYIAYSHEIAPTTGTPHLQGFISFNSTKTLSAARALLPGCHVEPMAGSIAENERYCSKAGTLIERGQKPFTNDNKGRNEQLRWQRARELAKKGNLDEIDADIYIRCYSTLKSIAKDYMIKPDPVDVKCFWIYGNTGTGKSHCVETTFPDCYKKSMDDLKWFDGYDDQDVIYLEDFDIYQVKWGGLMKRLADRWPMQASIKGSMKYIRPRIVIVTSNYRPEEIWSDPQTVDPLLRRFTIVEKLSQEQVIDFT
nr:MAG: replication-associated protein [Cressdnaviricota sp.]